MQSTTGWAANKLKRENIEQNSGKVKRQTESDLYFIDLAVP